jgi:hypothetical protein
METLKKFSYFGGEIEITSESDEVYISSSIEENNISCVIPNSNDRDDGLIRSMVVKAKQWYWLEVIRFYLENDGTKRELVSILNDNKYFDLKTDEEKLGSLIAYKASNSN